MGKFDCCDYQWIGYDIKTQDITSSSTSVNIIISILKRYPVTPPTLFGPLAGIIIEPLNWMLGCQLCKHVLVWNCEGFTFVHGCPFFGTCIPNASSTSNIVQTSEPWWAGRVPSMTHCFCRSFSWSLSSVLVVRYSCFRVWIQNHETSHPGGPLVASNPDMSP
jgi:hypothetical protein